MNRTSIHHSLLVLSVAMATAWPLSPAVADKGWPHEDVHPKFGLMSRADGPFPADRFTVEDRAQNTCERINLPKPDCTILPDGRTPSACMEVKLLNELDGFNTRPRIAIPFDGKIDLGTVNKKTIFLVSLGDAMIDGVPGCPSARGLGGRNRSGRLGRRDEHAVRRGGGDARAAYALCRVRHPRREGQERRTNRGAEGVQEGDRRRRGRHRGRSGDRGLRGDAPSRGGAGALLRGEASRHRGRQRLHDAERDRGPREGLDARDVLDATTVPG